MTAPIRVTVDEPVTREVTLEHVREYLRAHGWAERATPPERLGLTPEVSVTLWKCPGHAGPLDPSVSIIMPLPGQTDEEIVRTAIYNIARHERRAPAAVLRELASMGAPASAGIEPMTVEEIDGLDRTEEQWQRAASGFDATTVRRLIATVRCKEAEIERLRDVLASMCARDPSLT